jgi:hypothetical protein
MGEESTIRWSIVSNLAGDACWALNKCFQITEDSIYLDSFLEGNLKYVHVEAFGYNNVTSEAKLERALMAKTINGEIVL